MIINNLKSIPLIYENKILKEFYLYYFELK